MGTVWRKRAVVFGITLIAAVIVVVTASNRHKTPIEEHTELAENVESCTAAPCAAAVLINTTKEEQYAYGYRGLNNEFQKGIVEFTDQRVIDWTKALHLGWIRWPGGTNTNFFNWKTGLTDREYLAQFYQHTEHAEPNYYNYMEFYKSQRATEIPERLSDFKDFLQKVGARTAIPINPAMDSVDKVYDLAKFVQDNNIPVLYWELANEPFFYQNDPKIYANTDDYLVKMKPYRDAIKQVLPNATVLISYHNNADSNWNKAIANYAKPYWDGINFHRYEGGSGSGKTKEDNLKDTNEAIAVHVSEINEQYIARMHNKSQPAFLPENGVEIGGGVGETAYHGLFNTETLLRTLKQRYGQNDSSNIKYMGGFRLFNGYLQPSSRYVPATMDLFQRGAQTDATKYDFGFFYTAPAVFMRVMDAAVNSSSSYWETTVTGGAEVERLNHKTMPALYAQAFHGSYGNTNYVIITNKSDKAHTITVKFDGAAHKGTFNKVYADANGNPFARNNPGSPNLVRLKTEAGAANPVTVPPYSVVRLEWKPETPQPDKAPQEPWITHADATAAGTVTLKWLPSDGAASYSIKYGTSQSAMTNSIANIAGTLSSHTITGLTADTTYYFSVEAVGSGGTTQAKNAPSVRMAVPAAPLLRSVYVENSGAAGVEWQSVPGALGYKVRYKPEGGSYGDPIDVGNMAGTIVRRLTNGRKVSLQVAAYNGYGTGDYSEAQEIVPNASIPYAPNDVRVTGKSADTAALAWKPSYSEVYLGFFENGDGTDQGWTVQAGSPFTVVPHPDSARNTNVYKSAADGQQIIARGSSSWTDYEIEADVDVSRYSSNGTVGVVGRFQNTGSYYSYTYDNGSSSFRLSKVVNGSTVQLAARSVKELAGKGISPKTTDMTLRLVMEGNKLKALVNNNIIMEETDNSLTAGMAGLWSNQEAYFDEVMIRAPLSASYLIYRSTQPDTGYELAASGIEGTTWTDSGLKNGVIYYYKLKGVNEEGDASEGYSNIAPRR